MKKNFQIMKRGHDTKGWLISDENELKILSFHRTKGAAEKKLKRLLR